MLFKQNLKYKAPFSVGDLIKIDKQELDIEVYDCAGKIINKNLNSIILVYLETCCYNFQDEVYLKCLFKKQYCYVYYINLFNSKGFYKFSIL